MTLEWLVQEPEFEAIVLVCLDCYNNIQQSRWLKQQKNIFSPLQDQDADRVDFW